jgi:hypothetical protein
MADFPGSCLFPGPGQCSFLFARPTYISTAEGLSLSSFLQVVVTA